VKLQDLKDMDKDDFLGLLGLQSKRSFTTELLGGLGTFGIGLLVGAGVALLLAPKPGRELRQDIRSKIQRGKADGAPEAAAESGSSKVGA
jgi:gas vesicle protein